MRERFRSVEASAPCSCGNVLQPGEKFSQCEIYMQVCYSTEEDVEDAVPSKP